MARGSFTVRVSRQHESQQIHGPPTSYDTGPDFTRNHEEPGKLASDGAISSAKAIADWTIADSNGQANALIVNSPDVPAEVEFVSSLKQNLQSNCPGCKTSGLDLTLAQFGNGTGTPAVISALQRDPSIKYILNAYGPQLPGLSSALSAAGLNGKVKVAGYSAGSAEFQGVKSGQYNAYLGVGYSYLGWLAVDMLLRHQQGIPYDPTDGGMPLQLFTSNVPFNVEDAVNFNAPKDKEAQFKKLWHVS